MKPTPNAAQSRVRVEPAEHVAGVCLRLEAGAEILLSIEQARALSLALITAVNHQERDRHARQRRPAPGAAAPNP